MGEVQVERNQKTVTGEMDVTTQKKGD